MIVMSRTYKTDPPWVKAIRKDCVAISERHDHRFGSCDIDEAFGSSTFFWQRWGSCGYAASYYGWNDGVYFRPHRAKFLRKSFEHSSRASWRMARDEMLKLSKKDLEDFDFQNYQHRHSALWETY